MKIESLVYYSILFDEHQGTIECLRPEQLHAVLADESIYFTYW